MKRRLPPIFSLWILITVALAIFIGISFSEDIKIGSHVLSKAFFPETLLAEDLAGEEEEVMNPDSLLKGNKEALEESAAIQTIEPDTTVHSVLIFGDSMTHNLAMEIAKYGTKNKYKVTGVTWESSSIPGWANSGKISEYIRMAQPNFVIVSLGSNEMELKNFDRRIPEVKKIISQIDTIPYIWIGPPLWKEDKGVYAMLGKALPPGVLFKVENIDLPRGGDHVHPTRKGAEIWADTLMRWILKSPHPIPAERPDSGTGTKGHKFIYLHPGD